MSNPSFLFTFFLLFSVNVMAQTITMDNTEAVLEGLWTNNVTSSDKLGNDYGFAFCAPVDAATATATYRPSLPTAGKYHVEIMFPAGANRSTNSLWIISAQGGRYTTNISQRSESGKWIRIASNVEFASGDAGFVRLANNTGESEETSVAKPVIICDGVRFIYSGPTSHESPIIVDDTDARSSFGVWPSGKDVGQNFGPSYYFIPTRIETSTTLTYRPKIRTAGKYDVDIWYTEGSNRAVDAPWLISAEDGETLVKVDQTINGGRWVRIAVEKPFAIGTNGFVQVSNGTGRTGSVVVADAIRLVRSGTVPNDTAAGSKEGPSGKTFAFNLQTVGQGKIAKNPERFRYDDRMAVTLIATPAPGYVFGGWSGDIERMLNPLPLTVTSDISITANFWEAGIGVIMDDPEATFTGDWLHPERGFAGARYDDYQFTSGNAGVTATATYRPELPRTGIYDIYVWYAAGQNRAVDAPWEVNFRGGKETVPVNQKIRGGEWVLISSGKLFEKGTNGFVQLSNKASMPSVVIADAVAFVHVREP